MITCGTVNTLSTNQTVPYKNQLVLNQSESLKHLNTQKRHKIQFPHQHIQASKEPNTDLLVALKLSLLPDNADTCPSTGSPLFSPHRCLKQTSASRFMMVKGQTGGESRLTVQLVGSALSVRGLGGQEQGLVVQIAV